MKEYSFRDLIFSPSCFGVSGSEKATAFPSDRFFDGSQQALLRGITIEASREMVFSWLCQMRRAPYSYDWIDNLGRKSPRERDDSLVDLSIDDRFMYIFRLSNFERNHFVSLTGSFANLVAEQFSIDYLIYKSKSPQTTDEDSVRLLVKINTNYRSNPLALAVRYLLPLGDAIMMGKQLKLFKRYSEEDFRDSNKSEP